MAWAFGERALPQTERYAALVRRVSALVLALEHPSRTVDELLEALGTAEAALASEVPADLAPRVGDAADGEGRVYLDHSRDIGAFNPAFPGYDLATDGERATGTVMFPLLYEGPPGIVHGGFLAVLFDSVMQHHSCDQGLAGKTTALDVRYHAPTPVLVELRFEVERVAGDRRIESKARLSHGDVLCASATMRAAAGDRHALPQVSPRRP